MSHAAPTTFDDWLWLTAFLFGVLGVSIGGVVYAGVAPAYAAVLALLVVSGTLAFIGHVGYVVGWSG